MIGNRVIASSSGPTILLYDDFNRADGDLSGQSMVIGGTWLPLMTGASQHIRISGNRVTVGGTISAQEGIGSPQLTQADGIIEFIYTHGNVANIAARVYFDWDGVDNASLSPQYVQITSTLFQVKGTLKSSQVSSLSYSHSTGINMRIKLIRTGMIMTVFIDEIYNGKLYLAPTMHPYTTGTALGIGLTSWNTTYPFIDTFKLTKGVERKTLAYDTFNGTHYSSILSHNLNSGGSWYDMFSNSAGVIYRNDFGSNGNFFASLIPTTINVPHGIMTDPLGKSNIVIGILHSVRFNTGANIYVSVFALCDGNVGSLNMIEARWNTGNATIKIFEWTNGTPTEIASASATYAGITHPEGAALFVEVSGQSVSVAWCNNGSGARGILTGTTSVQKTGTRCGIGGMSSSASYSYSPLIDWIYVEEI